MHILPLSRDDRLPGKLRCGSHVNNSLSSVTAFPPPLNTNNLTPWPIDAQGFHNASLVVGAHPFYADFGLPTGGGGRTSMTRASVSRLPTATTTSTLRVVASKNTEGKNQNKK